MFSLYSRAYSVDSMSRSGTQSEDYRVIPQWPRAVADGWDTQVHHHSYQKNEGGGEGVAMNVFSRSHSSQFPQMNGDLSSYGISMVGNAENESLFVSNNDNHDSSLHFQPDPREEQEEQQQQQQVIRSALSGLFVFENEAFPSDVAAATPTTTTAVDGGAPRNEESSLSGLPATQRSTVSQVMVPPLTAAAAVAGIESKGGQEDMVDYLQWLDSNWQQS